MLKLNNVRFLKRAKTPRIIDQLLTKMLQKNTGEPLLSDRNSSNILSDQDRLLYKHILSKFMTKLEGGDITNNNIQTTLDMIEEHD